MQTPKIKLSILFHVIQIRIKCNPVVFISGQILLLASNIIALYDLCYGYLCTVGAGGKATGFEIKYILLYDVSFV
jgi:hypothetical protein